MRAGIALDEYIKEMSNALPPTSEKLLMVVSGSMMQNIASLELGLEFRSKAISNGFVAYSSTKVAARCAYRLWEYGQYLEKVKTQ